MTGGRSSRSRGSQSSRSSRASASESQEDVVASESAEEVQTEGETDVGEGSGGAQQKITLHPDRCW